MRQSFAQEATTAPAEQNSSASVLTPPAETSTVEPIDTDTQLQSSAPQMDEASAPAVALVAEQQSQLQRRSNLPHRGQRERLSGARITTNIKTKGEVTEGFGLVDSWWIVRKTDSGRMISVKVSLSGWMDNALLGHEVLTLYRDYFCKPWSDAFTKSPASTVGNRTNATRAKVRARVNRTIGLVRATTKSRWPLSPTIYAG